MHYRSIPAHPVYQDRFQWRPEDYPVSYETGQRTVSLPLSAKLTDADVEDVISAVREVLRPRSLRREANHARVALG